MMIRPSGRMFGRTAPRVGASVLASAMAVALVMACSSGSGGGNNGVPLDPVAQCQEFFNLTSQCYAKAGQEFKGNSANCPNPAALDERPQGEGVCSRGNRNA